MLRTLQDNQNKDIKYKNVFKQNLCQRNITLEQIRQCSQLLSSLITSSQIFKQKSQSIFNQIKQRDYKNGIGYFNNKNQIMLEYIIQLHYYQLAKINGIDLTSGQGLQIYKRLVYLKTLLLKLPTVDKKLQYQKNKLLRYSQQVKVQKTQQQIASQQNIDQQLNQNNQKQSSSQDALNYQPRPESLISVKNKKIKQTEKQGKYIAPKISAVLSKQDKLKRRQEIQQQRRKAFLVRKYRDDIGDDEQARQKGVGTQISQKIKMKFRQKTQLQQNFMTRLPQTKKQKFWKKSMLRKQQKSNPLQSSFKDIQQIRQIFTQKQQKQRQKFTKRKTQNTKKKQHKYN